MSIPRGGFEPVPSGPDAGKDPLGEEPEALPPEGGRHAAHQRMEDDPSRLARQGDALLRRDDPVGAAPPHVVHGARLDVHRGALAGRLPGRVGLRVVEGVRADARPLPLRVLAHVDEAGATGKADEAREAEPGTLRLIDVRELGVANRGEEPETEAGGTARRRRGRAPDEHEWLGAGPGRHANRPSVPLEGLAGPRLAEHLDVLLEEPPARLPVDAG